MIIGRRKKWLGFIRRPKNILKMSALLLVSGAIVGVSYQVYVSAEGDFEFAPISDGSAWTVSNWSPDPNLTWTFNNSNPGRATNTIEHVLKNEISSDVRKTKLKIYYDNPPASIQIVARVNYCKFEAGFTPVNPHQVSIRIGGEEVYRKSATREGFYSHLGQSGFSFIRERKYSYEETNQSYPGDNGAKNWLLKREAGWGPEFKGPGVPVPSQICNPDPPSVQYPVYDYVQRCGNVLRQGYSRANPPRMCDYNGGDDWEDESSLADGSIWMNSFDDPGNSCPDGTCLLDNRVFTVSGARAVFDPVTEKYVAEVEVELSGDRNTQDGITQQMRYKLESLNGGIFGYGLTGSAQEFGLGAEVGADDTNNPNGIKLAVPFGVPCSQNPGNYPEQIAIYDADTVTFGTTYVRLLQRDPERGNSSIEPVPAGRISGGAFTTPDGSGVRVADNLNKQTATFGINMEYGMQYMAVLINPKEPGRKSPERNVFSLRLPTESIYGVLSCKYELTPNIQDIARSFSYNPNFAINGWITSNGAAPGGNHEWQVTRITFDRRPLALHSALTDNGLDACTHMQSGNGGSGAGPCINMSGTQQYPGSQRYDGNFSDPADYPPGKHVCFMTSIKKPRWDSDPSIWRHSNMTCSYSAIKPKVQVWGGDAKSGNLINTSLTQINGTSYGSWGEYGVASNGRNRGMASGSGLLGGDSNTQGDWSALTFSNSNPFILGNFGGVMPLAYNPGALTEPNCNLDARTYGANEKAVIQCGGTLTITGNQSFAATYASIAAIPNIKIVADNIIIGKDVTRIDPWLVARSASGTYGRIITCGEVAAFAQLNSTVCAVPVKFNGPVLADRLYLFRTHDQKTGDVAAETFNLRADNILSSYNGLGVDRPVARTELITELPPRF